MAQRTSGARMILRVLSARRRRRSVSRPGRRKRPEGLPKYPSREKTRSSASAKISTPCAER